MADPTMADWLQGRVNPLMQLWYRMTPPAYQPQMSDMTTPGDLQRRDISRLGFDPEHAGLEFARRALFDPGLLSAMRAPVSRLGAPMSRPSVPANELLGRPSVPPVGNPTEWGWTWRPTSMRGTAPYESTPTQTPASNQNFPFLGRQEAPVDPYDFALAWQQALGRARHMNVDPSDIPLAQRSWSANDKTGY